MAEIGSTLREARMRAHIDISEVEASTKIRAKYLRAIENEEWDLLPGNVYVKSFLRTYSDFLGLDGRLLIDEFKRRYERPADDVRQISGPRRDRDRSSRDRPNRERVGRERSGRRRSPRSFALSPRVVIAAALLVIVAGIIIIGSHTNSPSGSGSRAITAPGAGHHKKAGSGKRQSGSRTSTSSKTATNHTTKTTLAAKARLQLVATGTVWVCAEGPDKKLLIPGLEYQAGAKIRVSATKLWIGLGNGNVTATVNGKPYTVPSSSVGIGFTVTPAGAKSIAKPPTCTP